jgi:hypothetical protein
MMINVDEWGWIIPPPIGHDELLDDEVMAQQPSHE